MKKRINVFRILLVLPLIICFLMESSAVQAKGKPIKVGLILLPEDIPSNIWYNNIAKEGFSTAVTTYSLTGALYPTTNNDQFEVAIRQCALDENNLCIAASFLMEGAVITVANEFPSVKFMLNDNSPHSDLVIPSNTRVVYYNHRQAGYLAGILAANMTTSDLIGVIGGMNIQPVNEFIEGFSNAAKCANSSLQINVIYADDFANPDLGWAIAEDLMAGGADLIYPVAGSTGDGALLYATQNEAWAIGVDIDQYYTVFEGGSVNGADKMLTSTIKRMDLGIYFTIGDLVKGRFTSGYKLYGLEQNAVGLAPYHETVTLIPLAVQKAIDKAKTDILKGRINIYAPCR